MQTRDPEEFDIQFTSAGPSEDDVFAILDRRKQVCPVKFQVRRGRQEFEVTVFVDKTTVDPVDYVKHAAHMLSLDFERLAKQTAEWRLPESELPQPDPESDETTVF